MTDLSIKVKVKDLKEAYEEGCDDVKRVLRKMYPEIFKEEKIYCCHIMEDAIKQGDFPEGIKNYEFKKSGYVIYHCPFCGKDLEL